MSLMGAFLAGHVSMFILLSIAAYKQANRDQPVKLSMWRQGWSEGFAAAMKLMEIPEEMMVRYRESHRP